MTNNNNKKIAVMILKFFANLMHKIYFCQFVGIRLLMPQEKNFGQKNIHKRTLHVNRLNNVYDKYY